jgi:hypothetical protein
MQKRPLAEDEFINALARFPRTYQDDNDKFKVRASCLLEWPQHCDVGPTVALRSSLMPSLVLLPFARPLQLPCPARRTVARKKERKARRSSCASVSFVGGATCERALRVPGGSVCASQQKEQSVKGVRAGDRKWKKTRRKTVRRQSQKINGEHVHEEYTPCLRQASDTRKINTRRNRHESK